MGYPYKWLEIMLLCSHLKAEENSTVKPFEARTELFFWLIFFWFLLFSWGGGLFKDQRKIKVVFLPLHMNVKLAWQSCSWLRRKWNSSPVVIAGAEDEEYLLTLEDIGSSLVFMYTPVTKEGTKGEPQYAITEFVKAGIVMIHFIFKLHFSSFWHLAWSI